MKEENTGYSQSQKEYGEEEEPVVDPNKGPDNPNLSEDEDPSKKTEDEYSDDTPVKVKINGKIVEMTAGELAAGYMRHSDYTRKTQELSRMLKDNQKKEIEKAQEVIDNEDEFPEGDIKTAEYIFKIGKSKFGLMTREEYEAEEEKKKIISEFDRKIESAKSIISKMKGMPAFNEDEIIDFMKESGIHDPYAAYLRKYDAQYRDFIIKQSKGDTSYKSDKSGKKVEPIQKEFNVRTDEGHRSFLANEIKNLLNNK